MAGVTSWNAAVALHADAVSGFASTGGRVPPEAWPEPIGPGRWTPAQVVSHLTLTYDALLRELAGEAPMRMRTRRWQRLLLRFTLRPRILAGAFFPRGIRAPREVRPAEEVVDQGPALERFRERAESFVAALEASARGGARVRLTHPYLGRMDAAESLRFCAAHIRHHEKQLPVDTAERER